MKLYKFGFGRKVYWNRQAITVDRLYGNLDHDYETIGHIIKLLAPSRILDVGCGSGRLFPLYLASHVQEVVGQDISKVALNLAKFKHYSPNIHLLDIPVDDLLYPPHYFDLIVCNRVLQHIPPGNIELTIKAMCNLSKHIYINEFSSAERASSASSHDFLNVHDYSELFDKYGFEKLQQGVIESEIKSKQIWLLYQGI